MNLHGRSPGEGTIDLTAAPHNGDEMPEGPTRPDDTPGDPSVAPGQPAELATARAEARRLLEQAQQRADQLVADARAQAERELAEARREASRVIEAVTKQAFDTFAEIAKTQVVPHPVATLEPTADAARTGRPARAERAADQPATPRPSTETVPGVPPGGLSGRRGSWGFLVYRLRWIVVALGVVLMVFGALWGPKVIDLLAAGGFDVPGSESKHAETRIAATVGSPQVDVVALYTSKKYTVDDPQFQVAVERAVKRVPTEPEIRQVATYWSTNKAPGFVSKDKHSTYLAMKLTGSSDDKEALFRDSLHSELTLDPAVGTTRFGGPTGLGVELGDTVSADLTRAETLSAPLLAVMLFLVFGGLVAAGLPLMIGGLTVVSSFVVLRLLMHVTDISVFAVNIITLLGLGLSIDYSLLIVSRYREEVRAGHEPATALARTMTTAGRSVVVSSVIVAVSMSGLMFFPQVFLRSMTYGGVAAVAVAAISSLTVLPAVLAVLGRRVDALRLPLRRTQRMGKHGARHGGERPGFWARLAHAVMARPGRYALAVIALLLTLAWPAFGVEFGGVDERQLPSTSPARQVTEAMRTDFGLQNEPITVLVENGNKAQVDRLRAKIAALPNARSVTISATKGADTLITVDYPGEARDPRAMTLAQKIRDLPDPGGTTVLVGGASALQLDMESSLAEGLWKMALLVCGATFVMLFWAFGSVVLPIKAIVMTLLTVAASFGVVVLVFQHGVGEGLLDFTSTGFIETTQPLLVLAILFGVTTDYEVFLLSRVRERFDAGDDNAEAVAVGMQRTGPIITSAALLILVVICAFSTSDVVFVKLIGIGMAVSILLDATIVRAILVPATMRLLGNWNWWAPKPVAQWWQRHRPAGEELDSELENASITEARLAS